MLKAIILAALLVAGVCQADDITRAGTIVAARGTVVNGTGHPLVQGSNVYVGEVITTEAKSFVVIQFYDGAKVTVRPSSEITIDSYTPEKAQLDLVSGGLRVITGAFAKDNPDNYKVKTPVALMGVRGTEFSIQLCGQEVCGIEAIN